MALGFNHPLTERSTTNISCHVKAAAAYGFNFLETSGPVQACKGIVLPSYSELGKGKSAMMTLFQMHLAPQIKAKNDICKDYFLLGYDVF